MKRFLSFLLAVFMMYTCLSACNQDEPVVDPDDGQQDVVEPNKDQVGEDMDSDIPAEDESVQILNLHIPPEKTPISVETVEKVIKLSVSSEGDSPARHFIIRIAPVDIPSGCTLQYDVYLETAVPGMGSFDMKINNGIFLCGDSTKVDEGGLGLEVSTIDLTDYASERWYHREIPLHNDGSVVPLSMIRFSAGGLTNGCTNVCYYDNIKVVDSEGKVVFSVDENTVAETVINKSSGISGEFSLVDDPAPGTERLSAFDYSYVHEAQGELSASDRIDFKLSLDKDRYSPALYIGEKDASCISGIRGYVVSLCEGNLVLYRSEEMLQTVASQVVLDATPDSEISIRLEFNGNVLSVYYLDDMDGVDPWPEFTVAIDDVTGKNYGFMDIYGNGYTVKTVSHTEQKFASYETTYVNPVILDSADPEILYYDGIYYLYNTSAGYKVYTSTDLVNWELKGNCIDPSFTWSDEPKGWQWAPDIEYYNGKFYMVCSIDEQLGLAVSDSPLGPFVPAENRLFIGSIDGHIFVDDDSQAYLYYVSWRDGVDYGIYCVKLDLENLQVDYESEVLVISPTEYWEKYMDYENVPSDSGVTEGPYMLKHNGLYYLTYSGSDYESTYYAMGYAVSESPMGPFVKYEGNPVHIGNANIKGTAHHCFVRQDDSDEFFIFYHNHVNTTSIHPRSACIDKARFVPTDSGIDRIETYGPTTTAQPMPLG